MPAAKILAAGSFLLYYISIMIIDVLLDALLDTLKVFPFLFVTYFVMECIEHKMGEHARNTIKKSGRYGPFFGAVLGAFPQCGFSTAASTLYSGRVITLGTLLAVYLSTSDEMIPIFISEHIPLSVMLEIILIKVFIGIVMGFLVDFIIRRFVKSSTTEVEPEIHHLCEHENCHCEEQSPLHSSFTHSIKITVFILIVNIVLGFIIELIGEDALRGLFTNKPIIGEMVAGLIGLIPNCAASVVVTQLYLDGALSFSAMMSGLLTGAGVGILVLFRSNDNLKKNIQIVGLLYIIGVVCGCIIDLCNFSIEQLAF